ncbi:MAG: prepilin peptidase [Gorillibacterium sp.]|nr:prepilin peptidase [Gorillibacterium sp.]
MKWRAERSMTMTWITLGALVGAAMITDLRSRCIPNWLTISGAVIGFILQIFNGGREGMGAAALGLALGFVPFFVLYLFGALGAGDVKLFAAIGSIAGGVFVLNCALYSIIFAGIIGVGIYVHQKLLFSKISLMFLALFRFITSKDFNELQIIPQKDMLRFPFMYAVAPATLTLFIEHFSGSGYM